jgi:hypothetical protein
LKSRRFFFFSVLVVIVFLTAGFSPALSVSAQEDRGVAVPVLISPHGTRLDTTPTYKWYKVTGATIYQYQVWKGTTKVLDKSPDSGICGVSVCQKTPSFTLGYNAYKWRVRAYKTGVWSAWSAYMDFIISPPSFNSSFNGNHTGWMPFGGATWQNDASTMYTYGEYTKYTNIYRNTGQYSDFDFSARMISYGSSVSYQYMAFRTGLHKTADNNFWYPGYFFVLSPDWEFATFKVDNTGTISEVFTPYTPSAAINKNNWNVLRVVTEGNHFKFYINGVLVDDVYDSSFRRGYVGFKMHMSANNDTNFRLDWAKLTVLEPIQ